MKSEKNISELNTNVYSWRGMMKTFFISGRKHPPTLAYLCWVAESTNSADVSLKRGGLAFLPPSNLKIGQSLI